MIAAAVVLFVLAAVLARPRRRRHAVLFAPRVNMLAPVTVHMQVTPPPAPITPLAVVDAEPWRETTHEEFSSPDLEETPLACRRRQCAPPSPRWSRSPEPATTRSQPAGPRSTPN